jgi:hypothetical protein
MGNMPTLQEVKEYFKNADKVRDHNKDKGFVELEKIQYNGSCFIQNPFQDNWIVLYHNKKGYAKILTHKEPAYTITKEQLLELENGFTLPKLKKWFPDVFEVKLEVGKWYKWKNGKALFNYQKDGKIYGFLYGKWHITDYWTWEDLKNIKEATEQEVFEALKNEAVKRGFKEGVMFKSVEKNIDGKDIINFGSMGNNIYFSKNTLFNSRGYIFNFGKWAEIIKTLTKKEAEEKLNCKIV